MRIGRVMVIGATELKRSFDHWMDVSATEDVYVECEGKLVTVLTNPHSCLVDMAESLVGVLPSDLDADEALALRYAHT